MERDRTNVIGTHRSSVDWQDTFISKVVIELDALNHWKISFKCVDHPRPKPTGETRPSPRRICTVTFDMEHREGSREGRFRVHVNEDEPWEDAKTDIVYGGYMRIRDLLDLIRIDHLEEYEFADDDGAGSAYWCKAVAWEAYIPDRIAKRIDLMHRTQRYQKYRFLGQDGQDNAEKRREAVKLKDVRLLPGKFTHYSDGKLPGFYFVKPDS